MKSFFVTVVVFLALGLCAYQVWAETGVYAWWAAALSFGDGYSKTYVFLLTFFSFLLPPGLLARLLRVRQDSGAGNGIVGAIFIGCAALMVAGSVVHLGFTPALAWSSSYRTLFSQAGWLPREVTIDPRSLPPLDHQLDTSISTTHNGRVTSTDVYIPLHTSCWPERLTPVVLMTRPDRLRTFSQTNRMTLTVVKRPMPFLLRKKWKAAWATNAIVVSDEGAVGGFWLYVWGLALFLLIQGQRLQQTAGPRMSPARTR